MTVSFVNLSFEPLAFYVTEGEVAPRGALDSALRDILADGGWRDVLHAELGKEPWLNITETLEFPPIDRKNSSNFGTARAEAPYPH